VNLRKTIHLTGDQEIPGIPFLEYEPESLKHWVGVLKDIEICFYGNIEAPQSERITVAQRVIPVLEALEIRARLDLDNQFNHGTGPLDEWTLLSVYFEFLGIEPLEEFSLHFGRGIWDWSTPYFAQYRLNSEDPVKSKLVGFSREDWRRSQFK
jgi:hypothetical protein